MKERRPNKLLVEPAAVATGDIAFNLIVFFLVCASTQPDAGRKQTIPKADQKQEAKEKKEDLVVDIKRQIVMINGDVVRAKDFPERIRTRLADKRRDEDRIVVVKSSDDTSYEQWIAVTTVIEDNGGIVTLQIEEEREVSLPQ